MNKTDSIQQYKYEDELVSIRIGQPGAGEGAFLAFDGNIQFGISDDQYKTTLIPLLEAIVEENTEGEIKFYKGEGGEYRLQCIGLMLVLSCRSGEALQEQAKFILNRICSDLI